MLSDEKKRYEFDQKYAYYQNHHEYDITPDKDSNDYVENTGAAESGTPRKTFWRNIAIAIFVVVLIRIFITIGDSPSSTNTFSTNVNNNNTAWVNITQRMNNMENTLNETYANYKWENVQLEPVFLIHKDQWDDQPVVFVISGISKRGFEHLVQSNTRESDIQSVLETFFSKPKKEFKNENLIVLLSLSDLFDKKPDNQLYSNVEFEKSDEGWIGRQLLGAWDSFNQEFFINPYLPVIAISEKNNITKNQPQNSTKQVTPTKKSNTNQTATQPYFTLGSTEEEVKIVMGPPSSVNYGMWSYKLSNVYFTNGKVTGWSNISNNLKVSIGTKKKDAPPINLGSTEQQVIDAMGTPSSINYGMWGYNLSNVYFTNGKVSGWSNISNDLKIFIGNKKPDAPPFTFGSSKQDVINAMGTPSSINYGMWGYELSNVYFDANGKVSGWSNISNNLKVQ